jgi:hypothetical protein
MIRVILQSAKIGAMAGFSLAIANSFLVLVAIELTWPTPDPKVIIVFTSDFFKSDLVPILMLSIIWAIPSALIGGVTSSLFGIIFTKYQLTKKKYTFICTLICTLIPGVYLLGWKSSLIGLANYTAVHLLDLLEVFFNGLLIGMAFVIFPAVLFILAGYFVSQYLYDQLSVSLNVTSPTP